MSVRERFKIFIKYSNLSVSAFEKSISASNGYVNNISKTIGSDKLEVIAEKYPNLNLSWLTLGEGEMLKDDFVNEESVEYDKIDPAGKRLSEYADIRGISIKDFALKCDIGYNNTASLLKGSLPLGMQVLHKIKKGFPNLNTEWILFGNGPVEINSADLGEKNNKEVQQLEQMNFLLNNALKDKDKTIASLEGQIKLFQELKDLKALDESPIKSNVGQR